jgi:hypothetical protein
VPRQTSSSRKPTVAHSRVGLSTCRRPCSKLIKQESAARPGVAGTTNTGPLCIQLLPPPWGLTAPGEVCHERTFVPPTFLALRVEETEIGIDPTATAGSP